MTEEIGWAALGIVPTLDRGFDSKLSRGLDPALSRVGSSSGKRFGGILGKAAVVGAAGVIAAGFATINLAKDSLAEAREAQEVGATSAAILKSTQHAAKLTRGEYDKLTAALMRKTAIDDEQIALGGNLLLTFKNVKREGKGLKDIFGRALASSLDLAAAGFGSIESTSKQLGKALNDPIKGMSALSRSGVTFTQEQQDTIKALVETGDVLSAQKIILKEVESQVGGTAEAQKTSAKELEVAWGNLKEELGGELIPVVDDLADVLNKRAIPAGHDLADWIKKDGIPQAKDLAKKLSPRAHEILPAAADAFGTIKDVAKEALPIVEDIVGAFNDMPDWAKKAVVAGGLGAVVAKKTGVLGSLGGQGGGSGLLGLVSKAKPLPVFVVNNGVGGTGVGGGKAPKVPGGAAAAVGGRFLGLASLNFLLKGDSAPENLTDDQAKLKKAWITLYEETGTESGDALNDALDSATRDQLADLQKTLKAQTGLTLREFGRLAEAASKTDFKFEGLGLNDKNAAEETSRSLLFARTEFADVLTKLPTKVETKLFAPGLVETTSDVDKLIKKYDVDLDRREVKTLYSLLGVGKATDDLIRLERRLNRLAAAQLTSDPIDFFFGSNDASDAPGGEGAGRPPVSSRGGVVVNIDKMVAQDYADMQRQLQHRAQQGAIGGIGVLP